MSSISKPQSFKMHAEDHSHHSVSLLKGEVRNPDIVKFTLKNTTFYKENKVTMHFLPLQTHPPSHLNGP